MHLFQVRSHWEVPGVEDAIGSTSLETVFYYGSPIEDLVDPSANLATVDIEELERLDVGIRWSPVEDLELAIWGQNLLDPRHREYVPSFFTTPALVERSFYGSITWTP